MIKYFISFLLLVFQLSLSQLVLGDVTVPRESCWVYIFIGHSNMTGRAPKRDTITNPKLWNYALHTSPNRWRLALESMYVDKTVGQDKFNGPGMPFLNQIHEKYPEHHFCLFMNGEGRATASVYLNNQTINGRKLYEEILNPLKSIVKGKVMFGGILAFLGLVEPYINDESACRRFATDMRNLVMMMRTELDDHSIPFIMGQYEMEATGSFSPTSPLAKIVIAQQESLTTILPRCILVPTDGVEIQQGDDHHWSCAGYDEFAKRMIDSLISRGYAPANPIPVEYDKERHVLHKEMILVSANPFSSFTDISLVANDVIDFKVVVRNASGRIVRTRIARTGKSALRLFDAMSDGKTLPSGVYVLSCKLSNGRMLTKRIVKV